MNSYQLKLIYLRTLNIMVEKKRIKFITSLYNVIPNRTISINLTRKIGTKIIKIFYKVCTTNCLH